ncbi:MAG: hypothetical protein H6851_14675 [Geminicoccaceae bacterium]|nr:hypothetical protein [Geminicoccaceae bacterium]
MDARKFLLGLVAGLISIPLLVVAMILTLDGLDRLKAPAFTNRTTLDEKLRFIRHRHGAPVDFLMLGSSTTLWGFDDMTLRQGLPDRTPLNVGVRDLKIHQAVLLARFYLGLMPQVRDVVMVSTLLDFESCDPASAQLLDVEDAAAYALDRSSELETQLRHLDPVGVARSARNIRQLRHDPPSSPDSLNFDETGSIRLDLPRQSVPDLVWRGSLPDFNARCYRALEDLARTVRGHGAGLTFVIAPLRPGYLAGLDPNGKLLATHVRHLEASAKRADFRVVNANAELSLGETSFFDAYHLRAPITSKLTKYVIDSLKKRNL